MIDKVLGPTFPDELYEAGLSGQSLSWGKTADEIYGRENLTTEQNTTLDNVVFAHDPTKKRPDLLPTSTFLSRWTNQEYLALEKKRRDDIANNKVGNAKNWDQVVAEDNINLSKQKTQTLKANLVTDGVLTQARADEIFAVA